MTLLLTDLSRDVLKSIVVFAGNSVKALLNCERTCQKLYEIVQDDTTWSHVPVLSALVETIPNDREPLPRSFFNSFREYACVTNAILVSWREQQRSENILLDVLGAKQFAAMIHSADPRHCCRCAPNDNDVCGFLRNFAQLDRKPHIFDFRGDTLSTLVEIVSTTLIRVLSHAHEVSCILASATGKYPIMTCEIFKHGMKSFSEELMPTIFDTENLGGEQLFENAALGLLRNEPVLRDTIILRLSHRAGIIRMEKDVFNLAWCTLIRTMLLVLRPACVEMVGSNPIASIRGETRRILLPNESICAVPPLSTIGDCSACHEVAYIHTLVPKQLEDSAKKLGLPFKVYGDYWMLEDDESHQSEMSWEARDALITEAEERYSFQEEDNQVEEEEDLYLEYYDLGSLSEDNQLWRLRVREDEDD
jgi:hypothetical protein